MAGRGGSAGRRVAPRTGRPRRAKLAPVPDVLDRGVGPLAPGFVDERAVRRTLLDQIARLETELTQLFCSAWPRKDFDWKVPGRGGPRLLSVGELEELRDDLAGRAAHARRALSDRTFVEEQKRCLIEEMLLEPEAHRWAHVSSEDIGELGCRHWHVRPRFGFLGMFLNWWRVVISSGCPLAT